MFRAVDTESLVVLWGRPERWEMAVNLKKLSRVVIVRKWFVVSAALMGAGIGYLVASNFNDNRQPEFEATATIQFGSPTTDRTGTPSENEELADALVIAAAANQDVVEAGQGMVTSNTQTGQLVFTARASEQSVAADRAKEMRLTYVEAAATGSTEGRQQRLLEIVTSAAEIQAQLAELSPPPPETEEPELEVDPAVGARLDLLASLINGLTQQHTRLEVDLILAEAGDERVGNPEEIRAELAGVSARLDEIYAEIAEISAEYDLTPSQVTGRQDQSAVTTETSSDVGVTTVPSEVQSPEGIETQWTIEALESRYSELASEYQSLFITDASAAPGEMAAVQTVDLTPSPAPVRAYTGLGFVLAAIVAVAVAFGESVLRGRVYVLADATPTNGLAEMPAAQGLMSGRPGWMVASASPRRIEGIHRLRIALLAFMDSGGRTPAMGLTPVGIDHDETAMLAIDLARRLSASGQSVLVLDVDFGAKPPYPIAASSMSVADLISSARVDPEVAATQMKRAFTEMISTESFRLIRSGTLVDDPADVFLTEPFRLLLEVAREQSDVVLIVAPEAAQRSTFSLQQRLDGLITVGAVGRARRSALLKLAHPGQGVVAATGMVLLTGWMPERRGFRRLSDVKASISKLFRSIRARLSWRRSSRNSVSVRGRHPHEGSTELDSPPKA